MTPSSKEEGSSQFVDADSSDSETLTSKSPSSNSMLASSSKSMETDISAKVSTTLPITISPSKNFNNNNNNNSNNNSNSNNISILQSIAPKRKLDNNGDINNNNNSNNSFINSKYSTSGGSSSLLSDLDEKDENTITTIISNSIEQSLKNTRSLNNNSVDSGKKVHSILQDSKDSFSSISRSNSTEPEFETTSLKSILEGLNRNVNNSSIYYFFPRDQFYNFICIYKGCNKPVRSKSFEQYLFHLRVHENNNHTILEHMLNNDGTPNLNENDFAIENGDQSIEEAVSFVHESNKKYESLFANFEQQQEAIVKTIIPFSETTTKKRRPERYQQNNTGNIIKMEEDENINASFNGIAIRSGDSVPLLGSGVNNNNNNKNRIPSQQQPIPNQSSQSLFQNKSSSSIPNSPPLGSSILNQPSSIPIQTHALPFSPYLQQSQQSTQQSNLLQPDYSQVYPSSYPPPGHHFNKQQQQQPQPMLSSSIPGPPQFYPTNTIPEDEKYATPTRYSSRGVQLREQMIKYGLKLFRMDSEGKYICFFSGCNLHMITNFSRHVAKHEKVGDVIKPELYHLSNLYQSQLQNPNQPQPPQAPPLTTQPQLQLPQSSQSQQIPQQQQPMNTNSPIGFKNSFDQDTEMYGVNQDSDDSRYSYHLSPRGQSQPITYNNINNNNNPSTSPPTSSNSTPLFYSQQRQQQQQQSNIPQSTSNGDLNALSAPTSPLSISANNNSNSSNFNPSSNEINWVFKRINKS